MVAMPKNEMTHIQNTAPGPPVRIAPATPTMIPVPTWAAMAVASAWNELMPPPPFLPLSVRLPKTLFQPSLKQRTCTQRVLTLYQMPTPSSRKTST